MSEPLKKRTREEAWTWERLQNMTQEEIRAQAPPEVSAIMSGLAFTAPEFLEEKRNIMKARFMDWLERQQENVETWTGEQLKRMKQSHIDGVALEFIRRMPHDSARYERLETKLRDVIMAEVKEFTPAEQTTWQKSIRQYEASTPIRMTYCDVKFDSDHTLWNRDHTIRNVQWRGKYTVGFSFLSKVYVKCGEEDVATTSQDLTEMQFADFDRVRAFVQNQSWSLFHDFENKYDRIAHRANLWHGPDDFDALARATEELRQVYEFVCKTNCCCAPIEIDQ